MSCKAATGDTVTMVNGKAYLLGCTNGLDAADASKDASKSSLMMC